MPIATLLLDAGANINQVHCGLGTPLTAALVMHRFQMEHAPNSVTSQNSPYADLCMLLIDRGCNVNADYVDGKTALHLAIIAGFENVVQKLLVPRSDMDRCDHLGNTPLHYACENGSQRLVDLLIIYGL
ncbi:Serine/threonine-protein phosphatase 6 regulatory ankyrin repeat subunit C, partial [Stegodyphus mimosarum]